MSVASTIPPASEPLAVTYAEAARRLSISERTVWSMVRAGDLPSVRIGERIVRIPLAGLQQYLDRQTQEVVQP